MRPKATELGEALAKAVGLGERMGADELRLHAPILSYSGGDLCWMYKLPYTKARGRALLAAVAAGRELKTGLR